MLFIYDLDSNVDLTSHTLPWNWILENYVGLILQVFALKWINSPLS
jgi:hypothetical protein